jgi:hypothetical protein
MRFYSLFFFVFALALGVSQYIVQCIGKHQMQGKIMALKTIGELKFLISDHVGSGGSVDLKGSPALSYSLTDDEADQIAEIIRGSHRRIVKNLISTAVI